MMHGAASEDVATSEMQHSKVLRSRSDPDDPVNVRKYFCGNGGDVHRGKLLDQFLESKGRIQMPGDYFVKAYDRRGVDQNTKSKSILMYIILDKLEASQIKTRDTRLLAYEKSM